MVRRSNLERLIVVGLIVGFAVAPGCALFPTHDRAGGIENSGFQRTATSATNPIPLPVEIVSDISVIASGYGNPQDGVWKPVHPEVERRPSSNEKQEGLAVPNNDVIPHAKSDVQSDVQTELNAAATQALKTPRNTPEGKTKNYTVRSGDTLMKISFENFGNIYRWREIYNQNRSKIQNFNKLVAGTVLTIDGVDYVVITKNGNPYLIRRGDTLGKISDQVYGVSSRWRSIWKNNPELIRDPNKIYAGFTLYYVPDNGKQVGKPVKQISGHATPATSRSQLTPNVGKAPASLPVPDSTVKPQGRAQPSDTEKGWVPTQ